MPPELLGILMWPVAIASIIGTVANVHRKRWCFIVWAATNAAWTAYNIWLAAYAQAALWFVYLLLALWGLRKWRM